MKEGDYILDSYGDFSLKDAELLRITSIVKSKMDCIYITDMLISNIPPHHFDMETPKHNGVRYTNDIELIPIVLMEVDGRTIAIVK